MKEDDFYNHYNLVEDEDIVKAKKKPKSKKPIKMSSIKKGSTYESVSINKEVKKEEILKEEVKDTPSEEFLVEYNIVEEKQQKEEVKTPIYIGFTPRLVIFCILVPILSVLAVIFLYKAFAVDEIVNIRYTEKSIIDYTVYSDDINIYTGENNLYDRSLINKIKLDLKYQFLVNQKSNIILDYKIIEDLVIADKNNPENIFYNESNKLI